MSDLNIRFSNCFNFINNTKQYLEANPTDWRNVYTEEALAYAECDLMEMELEADYDAEEYDALLNGNAFRSSKRAQRRKANIRHHKADRYHGKCFEGRNEEGKRIYKDRYCRNPVSDRVKYSDNAIKAREQEYYSSYPVEKEAKEVEVAETTEEAGTFDNFLWRLVDELPEQKYIVLFSFDNGQSYEDRDGCTNEFRGVMTKDEVIAELTKIFLWNDCEVEIGETEVKGLKGAKFNWDFGCDKWGWNGYESFTIIPVSRFN